MSFHYRFAFVLLAVLAFGAQPARASIIQWASALTPEVLGATGGGSVLLSFDTATNDLTIDLDFSGLSAPTIAAHIHCCTAVPQTGSAPVVVDSPSLVGFPLGVTSGVYLHVFDLDDPTNFTPAFVAANGGTAAGATAALLAGLDGGQAYLNIHTTAFPGGEIRGFPLEVPLPNTFALALLALGLAAGISRRRA